MTDGRHLALLISLLLLVIFWPFVVPLRFGVVLLNIAGVAVLRGLLSCTSSTRTVRSHPKRSNKSVRISRLE